jgi:hypothetical protein
VLGKRVVIRIGDAKVGLDSVWRAGPSYGPLFRWAPQKSLGYLIGDKLVKFMRMAERSPEWREQFPMFVAEIKGLFSPEEIRGYLGRIHRVGPLGHVLTDEQFEEFRAAGAVEDDPISGAEDVLRVERARALLLSE